MRFSRIILLILTIAGIILPFSGFGPFFIENGMDIRGFVQRMFEGPVSKGVAWDLMVSSITFWVFLFLEGKRLGMKYLPVYFVLNFMVGLSFAFPLFLFVREKYLEES
jgi:hypothetical protein